MEALIFILVCVLGICLKLTASYFRLDVVSTRPLKFTEGGGI